MSLERLFGVRAHGSTVGRELLGGMTTFVTMVYIVVVNPAILAFAGFPPGPTTVATILAAGIGTLLMAFVANRPFAVAPYMGENAFLAFGLAALGIGWQARLGAVFVAGVVFLAITLVGLRAWLARSISASLKHAFAVAIGLFLALVGLYESGVVTSAAAGLPARALLGPDGISLRAPDVPLRIGDWHSGEVRLALAGFLLIVFLQIRRVRGAVFLGIAATALLGFALGIARLPEHFVATPFAGDYSLAPIAGALDIGAILAPKQWPVLLTLLLMGFLDTLATLTGLGAAAGLLDEAGNLPEIEKPMAVDALSSIASALLGTSTSGAYIESATGIRDGARTGLASVATAALFFATLFFLPVATTLQSMRFAYAPALVAVGLLMLGSARKVEFDDLAEAVPAFATIALALFTYNIANGVIAGLMIAPLAKLAAGRVRETHPGAWALAAAGAAYFTFGLPH